MTSINQEMINKANTKCDAYEAPHLTIIPLRTSGAMLVGSMMNDVEANHRFLYESTGGSEPFNSVSTWDDNTTSQGWSTSNSFFGDNE